MINLPHLHCTTLKRHQWFLITGKYLITRWCIGYIQNSHCHWCYVTWLLYKWIFFFSIHKIMYFSLLYWPPLVSSKSWTLVATSQTGLPVIGGQSRHVLKANVTKTELIMCTVHREKMAGFPPQRDRDLLQSFDKLDSIYFRRWLWKINSPEESLIQGLPLTCSLYNPGSVCIFLFSILCAFKLFESKSNVVHLFLWYFFLQNYYFLGEIHLKTLHLVNSEHCLSLVCEPD